MTADLQDLFDQAGRNPPPLVLDTDAVLHRARSRRSRNRRITGAVAATVAVTVVLGVGLASQRLVPAEPVPATPLPTPPALGRLGSLAYALDGDIYVADADGSNPVRIADGAPSKNGDCGGYWGEGPLWSPDGRHLAYRGDGGQAEPRACDRTVNISDSTGHHVASFPGHGWAIAWSPDSTRVAAWVDFYPGTMIGIYGLDGVRQALLNVPPQESGDVDPKWSPDGASILVPFGLEVPIDGSTPTQLSLDDPRSKSMASYSPSGAEIAYLSRDGLAVVAADGSQDRVLVPGGPYDFAYSPSGFAWSPTGDRIAFASRVHGLAVLDVASGSLVSLADTGRANSFQYVKFSPEGDQILFTRTDAKREPSLWSVDVDGSEPHQLVAGTATGDWQRLIPTS